jgi:hypothetical protein
VDFEGWGGSLGAVLAQFSLDRGFRDVVGGELGAFALVPLGGSSAIPGCPVGLPCETRTTPNLLFGVNGSLLARAGDTGLRAAIGVGPVWATGGEGLPESVAWSALLGLDWVANSKGRFALTLSARALLLETSLAGATYLFLPGIGVTF